MNPKIILFDGVCNLCNGAINFVIDHDKNARFKFAALQSEEGQQFLEKHDLDKNDFDSFVLVEGDKVSQRSTAALKVAKGLGGFWSILYAFIIVPRPIRDFVYKVIAKNRYKWFGKRDACRLPTPELKERFVSYDSPSKA
ncbi:thiol-disulfide oxidoreductase DCC family protein [Limibacter armeniacum]|uniref:thiol-disulfide oxidoreductase DCC family protein n=1 Tax=Limibacter armeniacum TaxID=466084 RepID=UPI002FE666F6